MQPSRYKEDLAAAFTAACRQVAASVEPPPAVLEKPRQAAHGDFSCPMAMVLAPQLGVNPRKLAAKIVAAVETPAFVAELQVAGPGFINVVVKDAAKVGIVTEILTAGNSFGAGASKPESLLVEFVSANPTGPLHVGHGRALAYGDALANILEFTGYDVRREYYVNNTGRQMDIFAASVWLRYWRQQDDGSMPLGSYRGDYLIPVAEAFAPALKDAAVPPSLKADLAAATSADAVADVLIAAAVAALSRPVFDGLVADVCDYMMQSVIQQDMQRMAVNVDAIRFFSERDLHADGRVDAAEQKLQDGGHLYEKDGAHWFNATAFGDDKDRVVRRTNGALTYFAADIAYHLDKLTRPHPPENAYRLLNVLGADHHGYVPRLTAALRALGFGEEDLEFRIIQFVALTDDGTRVKMSTRAGEFVALSELIDNVGAQAARYFYVSRKNDQQLDFDLTVAKAQNSNNPIYYIQYANARIHSVMNKWGGDVGTLAAAAVDTLATDAAALRLCEKLAAYPEILSFAAQERAPHYLAAYLHELAVLLHGYYEKTRILPPPGEAVTEATTARLALLAAARQVFNGGAGLLGLSLPERM